MNISTPATADIAPPFVQQVIINNGAAQRTNTTRIDLRFNETVNLPDLIGAGMIADAIRLFDKAAPAAPLSWLESNRFQWDALNNRLSIDLSEGESGGGNRTALLNGRYELRLDINRITDAAGNPLQDGDGVNDGFQLVDHATGATTFNFHQLYGDLNGDATTDGNDLKLLAAAYKLTAGGDCDGDGDTDLSDLSLLAAYNGVSLPDVAAHAIVITRGGRYSGIWESQDPQVAAVTIRTAQPVVIENSTVRSRANLIESDITGTDITVRGSRGYGLNPNVLGESPGRFLRVERFRNVLAENNYLEGTSGIYALDYRGNGSAAETVRIIANRALNIDGRLSDGNGGFLDFNERTRLSDGFEESGFKRVQFVQLNKVKDVTNVEIAWNEVVNQPGQSRVEDNINIYRSSGTAQSPIRIHDNYIHGAYTIKPWQASYSDGIWEYDWDYSGGGIMIGDGNDGAAHTIAYQNQVVSTTNHGIAIYGGHDQAIYENRVLSSGLLPDGRAVFAQNVGIFIWDGEDAGPAEFYNNNGSDNLVGWMDDEGDRNDWWIPDATSFTNNTPWPAPLTLQTEAAELTLWQTKVATAGMTVGPTTNP